MKRKPTLKATFSFAFKGIKHVYSTERNVRIHTIIGMIVILLGFYFSITSLEWLIIILAIGGMIALEILNTAIERVVDLVTSQWHPLAKQAKDAAAGAVLVYALMSVCLGFIIFIPKILDKL